MDDNGRFGFDPEDFDRVFRDASEGLRDAFEGISRFFILPGERAGWSGLLQDLARRTRTRPETAGEAGDGVWVIYTVSPDGGARVEEVYATELNALRANQNSTDATRKVRFLPYGIAVSVLDGSEESA
jgi:hypothetical protein